MKNRYWMLLLVAPLCASVCAAGDAENLAVNPGFETAEVVGTASVPMNWSPFSSGDSQVSLTKEGPRSGENCIRIKTLGKPNGFQGINQFLSVTSGEKYSFSMFVMNDKADPVGGSAHGMLVIEWKDASDKEITRTLSKLWQASNLSRLRWENLTIDKVEVPANAVKAVFGAHLCEGEKGGRGSILIDDVEIQKTSN